MRDTAQLNEKHTYNGADDSAGDKVKDDAIEDEAEDALDMDDDEYTKQSSYQAQVKENLKYAPEPLGPHDYVGLRFLPLRCSLLVSDFDSEQLERYNLYRETGLKGPQVKRVSCRLILCLLATNRHFLRF